MSTKLNQFFDWYQNEKPRWDRVMDQNVPLSWQEHKAVTLSVEFIQATQSKDAGYSPTYQEVFENHTAWLRDLAVGQIKLWNETPRS